MRFYLKIYRVCKEIIISFLSLSYAVFHKLPGIKFDLYGRLLALKGIFKGLPKAKLFCLLVNPVSGIRYFELEFAGSCLRGIGAKEVLDVSSPALLPLWTADRYKCGVTMVNPDDHDLDQSKTMSMLVSEAAKLRFDRGVCATKLPYTDNSFNVLTSISAIEHINGEGDSKAMDEFIRVVCPGGKIILTFPVLAEHFEESRPNDPYGTQEMNKETGRYFFQRFYDQQSISLRIIGNRKLRIIRQEYFIESTPGAFDQYIKRWEREGLGFKVKDPWLMSTLFQGPKMEHPRDRMGNCHLLLEVTK